MKLHDKFNNNILNFVDEHVSLEWHEMTRKVKNKLGLSWAKLSSNLASYCQMWELFSARLVFLQNINILTLDI